MVENRKYDPLQLITFLEDEATADVAFIAQGEIIDEAFTNACLAFAHTIVNLHEITPEIEFRKSWEAEDLKGLLYDVLDDLIYLFDTDRLLLSEITGKIEKKDNSRYRFSLIGKGEKIFEKNHEIKVHVKAVTFFGMEITQNSVKVTLDI